MMGRTYYAVTTISGKNLSEMPEFYGIGSTAKEASEDFQMRVPFDAQDIYSVTRHKNVQIIPETVAIRRGILPRGGFLVEVDAEIPTHGYRVER